MDINCDMDIIRKKWRTIERLIHRLKEETLFVPVILVVLAIIGNAIFENSLRSALASEELARSTTALAEVTGTTDSANFESLSAIENKNAPTENYIADETDIFSGALIIDDSAFLNTGNPLSTNITNRDGLIIYKVQKGDTLSSIAANFGITLDTIYGANKGVKSSSLSIGQEITILPVSGIVHQVQEGETLDSIASLYEITESRITRYNAKTLARGFVTGINLIIPGAKAKNGGSSVIASLPNFPGYYALPTTGWNWGKLHNYNAVDIANACGTPIYAAAEGMVSEVKAPAWNDGYGGYVIIEHPNNTRTRYAHNQRNVVSVGDYVLQGDIIGYIGNTGLTHGVTGCHVHFEVMGARNPFAK